MEQSGDTAAECVAKCMICVLACAERFVKFFNKHAFTETALKGSNFCVSGANAMAVIMTNTLRFGVLHGLGAIVMIFAKLFITSSVCISSYFILKHWFGVGAKNGEIQNMAGPLIIIFIFSLVVANLFAHIWETSSDVILHCYCIDDAIQSSKGGQAKYASNKLNTALDAAKKRKPNNGKAELNEDMASDSNGYQ